MDNPSRSERSRNAVLTAAITIIARDGPGRLTLDAIAREKQIKLEVLQKALKELGINPEKANPANT